MDDIDHLSDEKLSETFAVEVAGWVHGQFVNDWWRPGSDMVEPVPSFATDANAVMPYLDKHHCSIRNEAGGGWQVSLLGGFYQMQVKGASTEKFLTFARAACIALIRAARRSKEEAT